MTSEPEPPEAKPENPAPLILRGATNKVEDSWAHLRQLESATDALGFKASFSALFVSCRSVPDAIDRELKPYLRRDKSAEGKATLATYTQWAAARLKERREPNV